MTAAIAPSTSHLGIARAGSAGWNTSGVEVIGADAAHFDAKLIADFASVEADGVGVALGETHRVGRRRKPRPVAKLQAFEMAARDPGLRRDVFQRQLLLFASGAQPFADRRHLAVSVASVSSSIPRPQRPRKALSKAVPMTVNR